jgi:hypothetical protein
MYVLIKTGLKFNPWLFEVYNGLILGADLQQFAGLSTQSHP